MSVTTTTWEIEVKETISKTTWAKVQDSVWKPNESKKYWGYGSSNKAMA
jgi:hypothetical protein